MKIAFLVGRFPCLSETFILNQITGLMDRGHEVDIFAEGPGNEPVVHHDVQTYCLLDRTIYCGPPANWSERLLKSLNILISGVPGDHGTLVKSMNIFRYGHKAASQSLLYKASALFKRGGHDIVLCHFGSKGDTGAILKEIGAIQGKVVTVFHGADMSRAIKDRGERIYDRLFTVGDLFLPISERWRDELLRLGCRREKISVHRMGIDTRRFSFSPRQLSPGSKVKVLTVARLVEKKGVEYGVRALSKALMKYPNIEYTIVGDGPLKNVIAKLIEDLKIGGQVTLAGWKRQDQIMELMQEAHILLAPSVTARDGDQEGIPVVLMEALAQGLIVLSTRHSGIPELIRDGENGFLVPERDEDALAERLLHIASCPERWAEISHEGRKFVELNYDINILNDRLVKTLEHLLAGDSMTLGFAAASRGI